MSRLGRRQPIGAIVTEAGGKQPELFLQSIDATSTFSVALTTNLVFTRLLEVASTFTAALTPKLIFGRFLEVASTFAVTLTRQASYFRALDVASTFGVTMHKLVLKTIAASSAFTAALQKTLFVTLAVTSTFTSQLVSRATYLRTLAVSGAAWVADLVTLFIPGGGPGPGPEEDIVAYLKRRQRERRNVIR